MVQHIPQKTGSHSDCQTIACFLYGTQRFITVLTKAYNLMEIAFGKLERYKSPGTDQILPKAGDEELRSEIHKFIHSLWNKEKLPLQWKESVIVPIHKKGDKTKCNNY
jgi:hypothetical protein